MAYPLPARPQPTLGGTAAPISRSASPSSRRRRPARAIAKSRLTISGWVAEQVTWWDDGVESNTYVGGIGTTLGTNVKFTGQATISPGWTAGYVIHLEADGSDTLAGTNQNVPDGPGLFAGNAPTTCRRCSRSGSSRASSLGKVGVGLQSMASDNTAILVDGSGSLVAANWVAFDVGGFLCVERTPMLPISDTPTTFGLKPVVATAAATATAFPSTRVRYDTPTFAGFSASAAWGEDDFWDVGPSLRRRVLGLQGWLRLLAYGEYDGRDRQRLPFPATGDTKYFQVGALRPARADRASSSSATTATWTLASTLRRSTIGETWYVKAGLRQRWTPLGHTVLYGEYEADRQ